MNERENIIDMPLAGADAAPPAPAPPANVPVVVVPGPPDRNPVAVYLAARSAVGRRGLERSLNRAAEILTGGLTTSASPSTGPSSATST